MTYATSREPESRRNLWHTIVLGWSAMIVTIMTATPIMNALIDWQWLSIRWSVHVILGVILMVPLYLLLTDAEDGNADSVQADFITITLWIGFAYQVYFLVYETTTYSPHYHSWAPPLIFVGVVYGWVPFLLVEAIYRILNDIQNWKGSSKFGFELSFDKLAQRLDPENSTLDQLSAEECDTDNVVSLADFKDNRDAEGEEDND